MPKQHIRHIVFVTEKNSLSMALFEAIQRVRPCPGALVTFLPTMMLGLFRFRHPEGLRAVDYPYVGEPLLQPRSDGWDGGWPILVGICGGDADGRDVREHIGEPEARGMGNHENLVRHSRISCLLGDGNTTVATLESILEDADVIVKATESYRGAVAFRDIVTLGKTRDMPAHVAGKVLDAEIKSMSDNDMDVLVASMMSGRASTEGIAYAWTSNSREMLYGEAKEFMDWNWDVNASATLSPAFRAAGLPVSININDKTLSTVSLVRKYAVLLAHAVRKGEVPCGSDGALIQAMKDWKGTGRHAMTLPVAWTGFNEGIGTIASRAAIIESLLRVGVCERLDAVTYSIPYDVRSLHLYGYDPGLAGAMQDVLPLLRAGIPLPTLRHILAQSSLLSTEGDKVSANLPTPTDMFLALDAGVLASRDGKPETMLPGSMRFIERLSVSLSSIDGGLDEPLTPGRLKTAGMLEARKTGIRLTQAGHVFLDVLGKASYDPDLPMRLDAWCRSWPASKPAMSAYIQRYFGNMRRALGMHGLLAGQGVEWQDARVAATCLVEELGVEDAAKVAQVSAVTIRAALEGDEVTPGQQRAIGLAAMRLSSG